MLDVHIKSSYKTEPQITYEKTSIFENYIKKMFSTNFFWDNDLLIYSYF